MAVWVVRGSRSAPPCSAAPLQPRGCAANRSSVTSRPPRSLASRHPGTRIRTVLIRSVTQHFGEADCDGDELDRFTGQAWADTTYASGLDATSRHIRFRSDGSG